MAWAAPAFCAIMCIFFFQWGDYFLNTLWAIVMGACGYCALRGLLFARRQNQKTKERQYFYMAVLAVILLEYCLWIASCYWKESSLTNPYFWFDMLQTVSFFTVIPALKRAVAK
jgi:H+/Cl- antiporter ClcA